MWEQFQQQHILDPGREPGYNPNWNRARWNDWLRERLPGKYGNKQINSVIISSPERIVQDFTQHTYGSSQGDDFWWSNSEFSIIVLNKVYNRSLGSNDYDVIDVGNKYFLARLNSNNEPIHFHTQYMDRPHAGNARLTFRDYPHRQ